MTKENDNTTKITTKTYAGEIEKAFTKIIGLRYDPHNDNYTDRVQVNKEGNDVVIKFVDTFRGVSSGAVAEDVTIKLQNGGITDIKTTPIGKMGETFATTIKVPDTKETVDKLNAVFRHIAVEDTTLRLKRALDGAQDDVRRHLGEEDGKKTMQEILANVGLAATPKQRPGDKVGGVLSDKTKQEAAGKHLFV